MEIEIKPYSYNVLPGAEAIPVEPIGAEGSFVNTEYVDDGIGELEKMNRSLWILSTDQEPEDLIRSEPSPKESNLIVSRTALLEILKNLKAKGLAPVRFNIWPLPDMNVSEEDDLVNDKITLKTRFDGYSVLSSEAEAIRKETDLAISAKAAAAAFQREIEAGTVKFRSSDRGVFAENGPTCGGQDFTAFAELNEAAALDGNEKKWITLEKMRSPEQAQELQVLCCAHSDGKPYPLDRPLTLHEFRYPIYEGEYSKRIMTEIPVWAIFRRDADEELSYKLATAMGMNLSSGGTVKNLSDKNWREITATVSAGYATGKEMALPEGLLAKAVASCGKSFAEWTGTAFVAGEDGEPVEKEVKGFSRAYYPFSPREGGEWCIEVRIRKGDLRLLADPSFPDNADILMGDPRFSYVVEFPFVSPISGEDVATPARFPLTEIVPKEKRGIAEEAIRKLSEDPRWKGIVPKMNVKGAEEPEDPDEKEKIEKYYSPIRKAITEHLREAGRYYRGEKQVPLASSVEEIAKALQKAYVERLNRKFWKNEKKRLKMGLTPEEFEKRFLKRKGKGR